MKKIILFILIFSISAIGQLTVDSFKEIYIPKIIKSRIVGNRLYITNGYDTSFVEFNGILQENYARSINNIIKKQQDQMNRKLAILLNKKVIPNQEIETNYIIGYFIIRNDRIDKIDYKKFIKCDSVRGSLTQKQSYFWTIMKYKIDLQFNDNGRDSTSYNYLTNAANNSQIQYLVPMINSKQELLEYLNNPSSIPQWTIAFEE